MLARSILPKFKLLLAALSSRRQCLPMPALLLVAFSGPIAMAADMNKTLHVVYKAAETGFDPAQVSDVYSNDIIRSIFDPLLTYDYLARPVRLVPNVIVAMPMVSNNATDFVFKIKPGIFFTPDPAFNDKPRELTAADYVYSFKRMIDPKLRSPNAYMLDGKLLGAEAVLTREKQTGKFDYDMPMEGLQAVDRYTLRIRLRRPDHNLLNLLAQPDMVALAREVVEAASQSDIMARPVGTGPYILKSWLRGSKIVLEANPNYRLEKYHAAATSDSKSQVIMAAMEGKTLPRIGRIHVSIIEEAQPRWLAFLADNLDYILLPPDFFSKGLPGGGLPAALRQRGITHQQEVATSTLYSFFNMEDPVVGGYSNEKIALRRAIIYGYNLEEDIQLVSNGQAIVAQSPLSPGVAGYDNRFRSGVKYDPALARALLDRFGYKDRDGDGYRETPDGKPLVIEKGSTPIAQDQLTDELWKKSMDAIGIRLVFNKQQWPDLVKAARLGKLQMWNIGWSAQIPDGDTYLQLLYGQNKAANNLSRFDLAAFNQRYEQASRMPESQERNRLYREMSLLTIGYGAWHMGVHRIDNYLVQPWVVGYKQHPFLTNAWKYMDIDEGKRKQAKR